MQHKLLPTIRSSPGCRRYQYDLDLFFESDGLQTTLTLTLEYLFGRFSYELSSLQFSTNLW